MNPSFEAAFLACIRPAYAAVFILWQGLALLTAAGQEALPNVQLRGPANVTACLKLQDGSMVIGGTFSSVDGVETTASLLRLNTRGIIMSRWAPRMKGIPECFVEEGGFLYVAGRGNAPTTTTYGAVQRIRLKDGVLDPDFSIRTLAATDRMFFSEGWLFITGNWEDSNIQAWWQGGLPEPLYPITARYSAFVSSVEWAGVHDSRLLVLARGTLWSLPLPAVKDDAGYSIFTERSVRAAALDGEVLWVLTGTAIKGVRPDRTEPDIVIPLPAELRDSARHLAAWKGELWISSTGSPDSSGADMKPILHHRSAAGVWRDIGSGLFQGRPGVLRTCLEHFKFYCSHRKRTNSRHPPESPHPGRRRWPPAVFHACGRRLCATAF